jgi:aminoglycoside phosphotransferase (APT) family kinase protein
MVPWNKPAAEHPIDAQLVRDLLRDQCPDLAELALREVANGWDNAIYRLGDTWCVRLPRRQLAADLVRGEQRWLPQLAERLPIPVPAPLRRGLPACGFPWPWSVCPWMEGDTAESAALDLERAAHQLGAFVAALHAPAPDDAPVNPFRGGPLSERSDVLHERVEALGDSIDAPAVRACWQDALAAPRYEGPAVWLHGDLHPANLVVRDGGIAAVIDFGDLTGGDPATDLALAWMLLPPELRPVFRRAAGGADAATWRRARGWALSHGVACLATSADDRRMRQVGAKTLASVLSDPDLGALPR